MNRGSPGERGFVVFIVVVRSSNRRWWAQPRPRPFHANLWRVSEASGPRSGATSLVLPGAPARARNGQAPAAAGAPSRPVFVPWVGYGPRKSSEVAARSVRHKFAQVVAVGAG